MKKWYKYIIVLTLCVTAFGCYYDKEEVLYPSINNKCDTTNVTYSKSIVGILSNNCYSCHSSTYKQDGGGTKLDTYADLYKYKDRLHGVLNHDPGFSAMPKNAGKLSDCSLSQIDIWVRNGAKND